ncbi:neurotensin receptor type 2 [Bombina bombina]|uniref:neurotensin receptor type 2 n=1 Tax=Bombina bombina TaxID=8345 RepID=UPI00235A9600|nr:neurotensin receptor type 2 [Bombina bombina]
MWSLRNLSSPTAEPSGDLFLELGVDTHISAKVIFTFLYVLIFLVGVIGNVLTIQLVLKKQSLQSLQGTVHYHLVSLALSDILILLVSIPIELYNFIWVHYPWIFGDVMCRSYYFLRDICSYATVLNITSLSCDRYLGICHPMKAKRVMSRRRTKKILALIWISSLALALPMAFIMGVKYTRNTEEGVPEPSSLVCTYLVTTATLNVFVQVNVFVSFLLPLVIITCLNCVTVRQLEALRSRSYKSSQSSSRGLSQGACQSQKSISSSAGPRMDSARGSSIKKDSLTVCSEPNRFQALQHSILMLRAIVIAYVVCWLPYHARRLMFCYVPDDDWSTFLYTFYHYFYMVTNFLFYASSAVNPVLYNVVSSSFRQLFFETLGISWESKKNVTFSVTMQSSHSLKKNICVVPS